MPQARQPAAVSGADGGHEELVIRVVKGRATAADIAALTSVLLARAAVLAAGGPCPQDRTPTAGWRRPERAATHRDPRGWRVSGSRSAPPFGS
ncbi:acyl-CoA carboxylase subunit epsilon [Streptomyces luteolifulvus]|uniref:Acyl-CoA carboxylase subunit epsilon n=1 Tax=Streptomyces luteolifulvus TaxID=2615112 RepID=A0A6H9UXL3_9ACTN|nr:acyl-CoA carboxylase subunit epsilon [Streptomyces luteolifulvus]